MGVFSFLKDVGEKLFGANEAKAATADELQKELAKHQLSADGLNLTVDGDKVTVSGQAASTEQAEKIVLALGNTLGVSQVDNQLSVAQPSAEATMYTPCGKLLKPTTARQTAQNTRLFLKPTSLCSAILTRSIPVRYCVFLRCNNNSSGRKKARVCGLFLLVVLPERFTPLQQAPSAS